MDGFFIALIVVGNKEVEDVELLIPSCTKYLQELYSKTTFSCGGRWLMINVKDKKVLNDIKDLIEIRIKIKK